MTVSSINTSTVEKFLTEYRTKGYREPSASTIRSYNNALIQYGRYLNGREITPDLQKRFVEQLMERHSSGYARTVYYATSAFHRWCGETIAAMHIDSSQPRVTQFTDGEWQKLAAACQTPLEKAVILTLFESGVRAAEALGMTWEGIDLKAGFAHITRKGGREGDVPLFEGTIAALNALVKTRGNRGYVFPIDYNQLYFMVTKVGIRVGMKVTPHSLRHARASSLRRKGVPLDRIQELLGHTDPKTTSYYYAAITPHQLREDIQKVG
jgi:integrase